MINRAVPHQGSSMSEASLPEPIQCAKYSNGHEPGRMSPYRSPETQRGEHRRHPSGHNVVQKQLVCMLPEDVELMPNQYHLSPFPGLAPYPSFHGGDNLVKDAFPQHQIPGYPITSSSTTNICIDATLHPRGWVFANLKRTISFP